MATRVEAPEPVAPRIRASAEVVAQLVNEYQAGASSYELAERHGMHRSTVTGHLRRAGVTIRMDGMTVEQIEQAVGLYGTGQSLAKIGRRLGFTADTVRARLIESCVSTRDTQGRLR